MLKQNKLTEKAQVFNLRMPFSPCCKLTTKGVEHLQNYLLSLGGERDEREKQVLEPEKAAPRPRGISCDELGLPWPAEPVPPCPETHSGRPRLKALPYWYFGWLVKHPFMVGERCKSEGEDWAGDYHLGHSVAAGLLLSL